MAASRSQVVTFPANRARGGFSKPKAYEASGTGDRSACAKKKSGRRFRRPLWWSAAEAAAVTLGETVTATLPAGVNEYFGRLELREPAYLAFVLIDAEPL